MEFPRHCHRPEGRFVRVENEAQYDAVIAAGFTDQPEAHVETPVEVTYAEAVKGEASADSEDAEKPKRGRKAKD